MGEFSRRYFPPRLGLKTRPLWLGRPFLRVMHGSLLACVRGQDDTFQDSYISTIGVDFVRPSAVVVPPGLLPCPYCEPCLPCLTALLHTCEHRDTAPWLSTARQ